MANTYCMCAECRENFCKWIIQNCAQHKLQLLLVACCSCQSRNEIRTGRAEREFKTKREYPTARNGLLDKIRLTENWTKILSHYFICLWIFFPWYISQVIDSLSCLARQTVLFLQPTCSSGKKHCAYARVHSVIIIRAAAWQCTM